MDCVVRSAADSDHRQWWTDGAARTRDGNFTIELRYPKRSRLLALALATIAIGSAVLALEHRR
jgi:hypothetical protein